jgi:hypothetical protein
MILLYGSVVSSERARSTEWTGAWIGHVVLPGVMDSSLKSDRLDFGISGPVPQAYAVSGLTCIVISRILNILRIKAIGWPAIFSYKLKTSFAQ